MRWRHKRLNDNSSGWLEFKTPIGEMVIDAHYSAGVWTVYFFPLGASDEVKLGVRATEANAKRFAESYIRKLAKRALEMCE